MASPAVHPAESLEDALRMLDSHVPLTFREKKLILTSLYDLAFREGARQGRLAGVETVQGTIRTAISDLDPDTEMGLFAVAVLSDLLPAEEELLPRPEYRDTTEVIREKLTLDAKIRQAKIDG